MGTVYLGESDGRSAAVKVVSEALADDPEFRARFRREVEVCRRVTGPQVARLYDADTEGSPPWLAVQYVEGPTLDQAVRAHGPLKGPALSGFAIAAAEALRQIHSAGVVHRDLKPSNVILTPTTPVIIDFGIAGAADATTLTATGTTLGTAGWMAPEQILGHYTGPASDVFAWGAVVAYSATGRAPFGSGRPEALAYRVVHGEPEVDGVPESIAPLVRSALAKDPLERPAVEEIIQALSPGDAGGSAKDAITAAWVSGETARLVRYDLAAVPGDRPSANKGGRRGRRAVITAGVGGVLLVAAALGWTLGVLGQDSTAKADAVSPTTDVETGPTVAVSSTTTDQVTSAPAASTTTSPPPRSTSTSTTTTAPPETTAPISPISPMSPMDSADPEIAVIFEAVAQEVGADLGAAAYSPSCEEAPEWGDHYFRCSVPTDAGWTPLVLVAVSPTGNYSWEYTSEGE